MKKFLPSLIAIAFTSILFINNALIKWKNQAVYRNYKSIDEPIRAQLLKDPFLYDESEASIIVINLWATWCQPCQHEIPHLNKLVEKYEQDELLFLGINNQKETDVEEWMDLQKHEFMYFQLYEQNKLMEFLFELNPDERYKSGQKPHSLPTNLIIQNGELVYYKTGYSKESISALEKKIAEILEDIDT